MESKDKFPYEQNINNTGLPGVYRVSFSLEVGSQDHLSLSDIAQCLTEGLGEALASKVSKLDIKKINRAGKGNASLMRVGDKVRLVSDISVVASFYDDDGYLFIGKPSDISNKIGEKEITLCAGSVGFVNKIVDDQIELIDMDRSITASFTVDDVGTEVEDIVNVDFILLKAEQLEKIEE